ncbi:MAG: protein-disulfide reductase DsbD domain-containing protein [Paracoccaceae bacterium]
MKKILTLVLAPVLALCGLSLPAVADEMDYGHVRLLNGWQMPDGSQQAALLFELNDGWKTYWRAPGPNGIPPRFDWLGSRNLGNVAISWPTPHMVGPEGGQALGYSGQVVIPIRFFPQQNGPVSVALYLEFGVCSDICIPASLSLLATLDPAQTEGRSTIEAALRDVPQDGAGGQLAAYGCAIRPAPNGYDVATRLELRQPDSDALVVIEYDNPRSWVELATQSSEGAVLSAQGRIRFAGGSGMVERDRLRVTVLANGGAFEMRGCPSG